jgi:hypothetical protein
VLPSGPFPSNPLTDVGSHCINSTKLYDSANEKTTIVGL